MTRVAFTDSRTARHDELVAGLLKSIRKIKMRRDKCPLGSDRWRLLDDLLSKQHDKLALRQGGMEAMEPGKVREYVQPKPRFAIERKTKRFKLWDDH